VIEGSSSPTGPAEPQEPAVEPAVEAAVEAARALFRELDSRPVSEHPEVYEAIQQKLHEALLRAPDTGGDAAVAQPGPHR
jgi:hypothetical protein